MPRKPKGNEVANVYSFSIPGEYEPLMRKFDEICAREGKGRGDFFLEWVADHVAKHYPGNPQTLITYQPPFNRPRPPTLEIQLVAKSIRGILSNLEDVKTGKRKPENPAYFKRDAISNLSKRAIRLEALNRIIKEEQYSKLLDEVSRILKENQAI